MTCGCVLVAVLASLSMSAQSGANTGAASAFTGSLNLLCDIGRVIFASKSVENSLISSPLKLR